MSRLRVRIVGKRMRDGVVAENIWTKFFSKKVLGKIFRNDRIKIGKSFGKDLGKF
jgi:hypothetical protein